MRDLPRDLIAEWRQIERGRTDAPILCGLHMAAILRLEAEYAQMGSRPEYAAALRFAACLAERLLPEQVDFEEVLKCWEDCMATRDDLRQRRPWHRLFRSAAHARAQTVDEPQRPMSFRDYALKPAEGRQEEPR